MVGHSCSEGWEHSSLFGSFQVKGSLLWQPKDIPPKKGHELVVGGESRPKPGVQSGHGLLQGGRCLMLLVPHVSSTVTVTEAGVDGLPLERAEQKRRVLRAAPWAA